MAVTAELAAQLLWEALAELAAYCRERGSEFLYVMAPYKICQYDDTDLSGVTDFSTDSPILSIQSKKVRCIIGREGP